MKNNFFAIHTLGCKVNLFESNKVINDLLANGYLQVDFNNYADIYIINTCSVTGKADTKSRNYIRKAKRKNPNAIVVVMGCYSQMNEADAQKLAVDIWIGNKYKNQIVQLIDEFVLERKPINRVDNLLAEKTFEENSVEVFNNNTRAFIKIQDGCNFMCSYCIIPFSRGRQRSKKLENIIDELQKLVANDFKEIVLTGVNTAGYLDPNHHDFGMLLEKINELQGDFRIRISSIEPFQINDKIINIITNNPNRFCQQWHICLQSGSNEVLDAMNRKYTTEQFLELIEKIRAKSPRTTFTTDYIVGFPTETDQDHLLSIDFIQKVGFLKMHIFPFSKRKNTKAAKLSELNESVKKVRLNQITLIAEQMQTTIMEQFIGQELTIVFEEHNQDSDYQNGYSDEYINILYKSKENLQGKKLILKGKQLHHGNLIAE